MVFAILYIDKELWQRTVAQLSNPRLSRFDIHSINHVNIFEESGHMQNLPLRENSFCSISGLGFPYSLKSSLLSESTEY
jgi:hypothetical protein